MTKELDSYFVRMTVLYAKIDVPGGQPINAFCTHLGSPLDIIPYAGKYGSWQGEHLHQMQQLREYIDQKAGPRGRVILMGDMNSGPDGNGMVGEWADNYAALVANDLVDPYFAQRNVDCTWCPDNSWVDDTSPKRLIGHILLRNFGRSDAHVARILETPINLVVQGTSITTNLSDHYGLRAEIELE